MTPGTLSPDNSPGKSPSTAIRRRRQRPLTNTNTDRLCHNGSIPSKWMYRFNLWTGLYMLNPYERIVFHLVGWFSFTVSLLYVYVFWKGFVEGFRHGT
mmetsp:Transcript_3139/g.6777  ORF Transcript_3139/g.6777 Transcript_3139/m.6777 type:complete len:98 (+) Transcript_3139:232-525(+)